MGAIIELNHAGPRIRGLAGADLKTKFAGVSGIDPPVIQGGI
jgi:hypothetical protein